MCNVGFACWCFLLWHFYLPTVVSFKLSTRCNNLGCGQRQSVSPDCYHVALCAAKDDKDHANLAEEFLAHIFSNPVYDERPRAPPERVPYKVENKGLLKDLGKPVYEDLLEEIRNEVSLRVAKQDAEDNGSKDPLDDVEVGQGVEFKRKSIPPKQLLDRFHDIELKSDPASNFKTERTFTSEDLLNGMRFRRLGETDLVVSEMCMGTCMFDNPELVDFDHALEIMETGHKRYGINFFDTCEYDPFPYEPKSYLEGHHKTLKEFLKRVNRKDIVLSGRISSSNLGTYKKTSRFLSWVRDDIDAEPSLKTIEGAVDKLLESLGTDYLDILSLVYPYRYVPRSHLGEDTYCWSRERLFSDGKDLSPDAAGEDEDHLLKQCEIFDILVEKGKIRSVGLSNETVWGMFQFKRNLKRKFKLACSQHMYNMLNRNEVESSGISEACLTENLNCPVVAYATLAGGILTGKYLDPQRHNPLGADKVNYPVHMAHWKHFRKCEIPEDYGHLSFGPSNARCNIYPNTYHTHRSVWSQHATAEYLKLARTHGMTLTHLSLAWVLSRPFVASSIIGPRTIGQLHDAVSVLNDRVTRELEEDVHEIFLRYRAPTMGGPLLLSRIGEDEIAPYLSQNERLRTGTAPIWSGGSHWEMENVPTRQKLQQLEEHEHEYTDVLRIFGLLDKPNDANWSNYRCWVERINEFKPGEYFALKESAIFAWDKMKLDEFTVINKTPEEIERDSTMDFHFYWRGGKIYVGETSQAIRDFYKDPYAVVNVMKTREWQMCRARRLGRLTFGTQSFSQFDADSLFRRLKDKYGIDILKEGELRDILYKCGLNKLKLSLQEEKCVDFAVAKPEPDPRLPRSDEHEATYRSCGVHNYRGLYKEPDPSSGNC